jgi:multiple sugar transport system substrate-binding protein
MPDIAWEYCRFIGSKENQKKYCRITLPVYRSLYDDAALSGTPLGVAYKTAKEQYDYVHARPGVFYYRKISMTLQDEIEEALEGKKEPAVALAAAAVKLKDAAKDKPSYKR